MPKMHAGHLDVYGIITVGADISATKYSLPRNFGGTGEALVSVGGEVVFTNPAPYIDIRQTSGGEQLWNDVEFIKESILDVSGSIDTFVELLDTPKPALSVDLHGGEIIIVNPDAQNSAQKISYSGFKTTDFLSISGGNMYGDIYNSGNVILNSSNYKTIISNSVNPLDMGYDIVLCCGQSNMTGRGIYDYKVDLTSEKVYQFGGSASTDSRYSTIYQAQDSLSHAQSISASYFSGVWHIGPSMYFARNYVNIVPPNRRVLLVPCAWGATSMVSGAWSPFAGAPAGSLTPNITSGSMLVAGALYENAISQANKAIQAAKVEYPHSRFVGTIWLQGENDGSNSVSQSDYADHLDGLISGFRSRITNASNSWFIVGQMLPEAIVAHPTYSPIDQAHIYTLTRNNLTGLALNVSGQSNNDNLHYNATGLHIMGIRMAEQVQAAKYNVAGTDPIPPSTGPYICSTGSGNVTVYWDAPLCRATDYTIVYRTSPSGSWNTVNMGSPYRRIAITGLTPSTDYDFAIYTINELGTSNISPITTFNVV